MRMLPLWLAVGWWLTTLTVSEASTRQLELENAATVYIHALPTATTAIRFVWPHATHRERQLEAGRTELLAHLLNQRCRGDGASAPRGGGDWIIQATTDDLTLAAEFPNPVFAAGVAKLLTCLAAPPSAAEITTAQRNLQPHQPVSPHARATAWLGQAMLPHHRYGNLVSDLPPTQAELARFVARLQATPPIIAIAGGAAVEATLTRLARPSPFIFSSILINTIIRNENFMNARSAAPAQRVGAHFFLAPESPTDITTLGLPLPSLHSLEGLACHLALTELTRSLAPYGRVYLTLRAGFDPGYATLSLENATLNDDARQALLANALATLPTALHPRWLWVQQAAARIRTHLAQVRPSWRAWMLAAQPSHQPQIEALTPTLLQHAIARYLRWERAVLATPLQPHLTRGAARAAGLDRF